MSKDKIEVNMNIYDIPILVEQLEKANKEIERLNNIINELEKWLEKEQVNSVDLDEWTIIQVRDKILELKGVDKE